MKRCLTFLLITALSLSTPGLLFASIKSEAKEEIGKAKDLLRTIERTKKFHNFVPYRSYYDGKVYLDSAIYQYEEEREYEEAALYAVLARVELETTLTLARARVAAHNKSQTEKEYFRNLASRASRRAARKIAIIEANLQKSRRSYRAILFDNAIFKMGSLSLNNDGIEKLKKIYNVLKLHPGSRVAVVGYTRLVDTNNTISRKKAEAVSSYLMKTKRLRAWRVTVSGEGKKKPMEINGRMRTVDRIELTITGIR